MQRLTIQQALDKYVEQVDELYETYTDDYFTLQQAQTELSKAGGKDG